MAMDGPLLKEKVGFAFGLSAEQSKKISTEIKGLLSIASCAFYSKGDVRIRQLTSLISGQENAMSRVSH